MAFPLLPILVGAALGSKKKQSVTNTSSSVVQFNPAISISLGGGVNSNPYGALTSNPTATTAQSDTDSGNPLGALLGGLGTVPSGAGLNSNLTANSGAPVSKLVLFGGAAVVGWLFLKG